MGKITAAMGLPRLTAQQRMAVNQLSADFRGTYGALCQQMADIMAAAGSGDGRNGWQMRIERQRELEKVRSERDDLSHKTVLQLRALLTDEQVSRLGLDSGE